MDISETTALFEACASGDDSSVARLLSEGAKPSRLGLATDAEGFTPLMRAVLSGSSRSVNLLLANNGALQVPLQNKVRLSLWPC